MRHARSFIAIVSAVLVLFTSSVVQADETIKEITSDNLGLALGYAKYELTQFRTGRYLVEAFPSNNSRSPKVIINTDSSSFITFEVVTATESADVRIDLTGNSVATLWLDDQAIAVATNDGYGTFDATFLVQSIPTGKCVPLWVLDALASDQHFGAEFTQWNSFAAPAMAFAAGYTLCAAPPAEPPCSTNIPAPPAGLGKCSSRARVDCLNCCSENCSAAAGHDESACRQNCPPSTGVPLVALAFLAMAGGTVVTRRWNKKSNRGPR